MSATIPHVHELPLRKRLRIYFAGAEACERYEVRRADLIAQNDLMEMRQALQQVVNILGPESCDCAENGCEGCQVEMAEALKVAKDALMFSPPSSR